MERRDTRVKYFAKQMYSDGLPVLLSLSILAPIERYLIISQTRTLSRSIESYPNLSSYIVNVPSREGIFGYWRGNFSALSRYFLLNALRYRVYHSMHGLIFHDLEPTGSELVMKEALVVVSSLFLAQLVAYPCERARTCVACDLTQKGNLRNYTGAIDVTLKTITNSGIKGLYSGFLLSIGTNIPFLAISHQIAEILSADTEFHSEKSQKLVISAVIAQAVVYPLEILKKRRQVADGNDYKLEGQNIYVQLKNILKEEGGKGLYRGFSLSTLRTFPLIGLQSLFYSYFNKAPLAN